MKNIKVILVTNKATGEVLPFGSYAAVFEHFTPEELGTYYQAATAGQLKKYETPRYKIEVTELIKSSKAQAAGRKTATLRGLCGVGKA